MKEALLYNNNSRGYKVSQHIHCLLPTKEEIEEDINKNQQDPLAVPWDDDNFSLCLDSFPDSRFAKTNFNRYPMVSSPLRQHWRYSTVSEENEEGRDTNNTLQGVILPGKDEEKDEFFTLNQPTIASIVPVPENLTSSSKASPKRKKKRDFNKKSSANKRQFLQEVVIGSVFPYNNNSNFLAKKEIKTRTVTTTTITKEKEESSLANSSHDNKRPKPSPIVTRLQKNHRQVEHISPLSDSSIFLQNENDVFNKSENPCLSHSSSISSLSRGVSLAPSSKGQRQSEASGLHSQPSLKQSSNDSRTSLVSNSSTEVWKVTTPKRQNSYPSNPVSVPSASNNELHRAQSQQAPTTMTQVSDKYNHQHQLIINTLEVEANMNPYFNGGGINSSNSSHITSSSLAASSVIIGTDYFSDSYSSQQQYSSSSFIDLSSDCYHTPNGSISGSKPPSLISSQSFHSIHVPKNADNLILYGSSTSTDSSISNKSRSYSQLFNPSNHKNRGSKRQKKKQVSLFSRLMKNIKQHFIKSES
ncbi:MAG: hypothetical protein EXX96DRAFT_634410 [Benjaminiella poitrasii]|nr:MAG: hypothetical protein EXX96DRAFT_634410 [Benjaminiella poitrasii]